MLSLLTASDIARSPGDPKILETGPSSRGASDRAAHGLGWFSIALGMTELLAAPRLTRALGVEGHETLVRAMGIREIAHGVTSLSPDKKFGVWSRVAGDALDIAGLVLAYRDDNPKKHNVGLALASVIAVTLADIATAQALTIRHSPSRGEKRDYRDRSGWPRGLENSRGAAAGFDKPGDMRAVPSAARASEVTGRTSPATEEFSRSLETAE
ncbi:MAG: hypothetical protein JWN69_1874 [Alphaproteobacteria bacterium]|nr:hypothetical protein [Alphaproteobacteria bacterium]